MIDKRLIEEYKPKSVYNFARFNKPFIRLVDEDGFEYIHPKFQQDVKDMLKVADSFPREVISMILFGSCISYGVHNNSDIDVLVIVEDDTEDAEYITNEIGKIRKIDTPMDIVIDRKCEFLNNALDFWKVERSALTEGFEIWRREGAWD